MFTGDMNKMRDFCPKCEADITDTLYALELHDDKNFIEFEKFECPECGAKLKVKLEASFYIEEDNEVKDESKEGLKK